jgi:hypothetical protein
VVPSRPGIRVEVKSLTILLPHPPHYVALSDLFNSF